MFKNQPITVKLSHNGPFTSHQTAPLSFNQTVRNIAVAYSAARHEASEAYEQFNLSTIKTDTPSDKTR